MESNERFLRFGSFVVGILLLFLLFCFVNLLISQAPGIVLFKQYITYLRMPIIAGLIFFLFPIFSESSNLFQNLFVMRGARQLISVLFFSTVTAFMITSSFELIVENAPYRFGIESISQINLESLGILKKIIDLVISLVLLLPEWLRSNPEIILLAPMWLITIWLSAQELDFRARQLNYIVAGLVGLILSLLLGIALNTEININHLTDLDAIGAKPDYTSEFLLLITGGFTVYVIALFLFNPQNLRSRLNPENNGNTNQIRLEEAPALFYVLLLIWLFTGVFSLATFIVDKWHIPVVLIVILLSGSMYLVCYVDNFFKLDKCEAHQLNQRDNFPDIINNRLRIQDEWIQQDEQNNQRTLVVIATSGGGIQASGWTAQVLCGLQEELGPSFTQSIGLISSVSGGSVGTMFFLDQFDDTQHCPTPTTNGQSDQFENQTLNTIFNNATTDWLDAVGWGLAYPDMIRGFFGISLGKHSDRGYSLEWDWQRDLRDWQTDLRNIIKQEIRNLIRGRNRQQKEEIREQRKELIKRYLNKDKSTATLASWRKKVLAGKIPIPVFNATLVEDGRRFLISPTKLIDGTLNNLIDSLRGLNLNQIAIIWLLIRQDNCIACIAGILFLCQYRNSNPQDPKALDFHTLYRGYDLDVTTAARLSASFPYVSPVARNDSKDGLTHNYHVADGGFFDNAGLFTAIEWLDTHLDSLNVKRVLLIQINAIPGEKLQVGQRGGLGWLMRLIGPLTTLNSIRDSTQIARNSREIDLIKDKWISNAANRRTVDFRTCYIGFPDKDEYNPPLSWRLTGKQIDDLKKAWNKAKTQADFQALRQLWRNSDTDRQGRDNWNLPESFSSIDGDRPN